MSESCETETVEVEYFLDVEKSGVSGVQVWGPFKSRQSTEDVVKSLAVVSSVDRVTVRKELA